MNFSKNFKFFLIIFLFIVSFSYLYSDSYSGYRMNNFNYKNGGYIPIYHNTRLDSINQSDPVLQKIKTHEFSSSNFQFLNSNYINSKYYTQEGGAKEDISSKYHKRINISPEFNIIYKNQKFQSMITISPFIYIDEVNYLNKNISKKKNGEILYSMIYEIKNTKIKLETGRGYQRLDSFGLLFTGFSNFATSIIELNKYNTSLSVTGLTYNYNLNIENTNNRENKIYGTSLLFKDLFFMNSIRFFYYKLEEPMQVSLKGTIFEKKKDFLPMGNYQYKGFEFNTKKYKQIFDVLGGTFIVTGDKDNGEYWNQKWNNRTSTNGLLSYLIFNLYLKIPIKIGGLYSSKDKITKLDKQSNGYSGIQVEPSIFGGMASFLLMEDYKLKNEHVFSEMNEQNKLNFENKGMQVFHISALFNINQKLQLQTLFNHSVFEGGMGNELILMGIVQLSQSLNSFLLISGCKAMIDTKEKQSYLFNEWKLNSSKKEFTRFYISGGINF